MKPRGRPRKIKISDAEVFAMFERISNEGGVRRVRGPIKRLATELGVNRATVARALKRHRGA